MRVMIAAIVLVLVVMFTVVPVIAACFTNTYILPNGKVVICTTCCFGYNCTTNCF